MLFTLYVMDCTSYEYLFYFLDFRKQGIVIEDIHVQHRSIDHQATRQNVDFWRYSNVQNIGMTI